MCKKMIGVALIWAIIIGSIGAQEPPYNYYPGVVLVKFSRDVLSQANLPTITSDDIVSDEIRTFLEGHDSFLERRCLNTLNQRIHSG